MRPQSNLKNTTAEVQTKGLVGVFMADAGGEKLLVGETQKPYEAGTFKGESARRHRRIVRKDAPRTGFPSLRRGHGKTIA